MRWLSDLITRLRPEWRFGVSSALGFAVIAAAAVAAGNLVEDVTEGDGIAALDHPVADFVAAHRSGALTVVMRAASSAGGPVVLAAITMTVGVLLGITWRSWYPVLVTGVTVAGNSGLTMVLKMTVARPRPPRGGALTSAAGYAFPSGHAATAAAAFGILAYLCVGPIRSWAARVAVWAAAAMLTTLVGISRIYLGVHWTTDVLGGWAFGVLWLAIVITGSTAIRSPKMTARKPRPVPPPDRTAPALPGGQQGDRNDVYSRQYVADMLRRCGYPKLAEEALRELPDSVDAGQIGYWGMRHGVSGDSLISRMLGS
jgi:undecaprenyl-diphosphatase